VNENELREVADLVEIRRLVDTYAFCADRVDNEGAAALFTPDGVLRIFERGTPEPVRERHGRNEIAAAFKGLDRYELTLHVVGNHVVDLDGDSATGETYCIAHHVRAVESGGGPDGRADYVMHIRYIDEYSRLAEGWRLATRELQVEFTEDRPVSGR
jgi:hypothetical protein